MTRRLVETLNWIKENILAVLIVSFVIPGVLAVYSQQSDVTKAIFETDYKAAKVKSQECNRIHSDYLSIATTNMGAALMLQKHFNWREISKYGDMDVYAVAFRGTMETYQKTNEQLQDSFKNTSRCYGELYSIYENLALALNLNNEFQEEIKSGNDRITTLVARRNAIAKDISNRVDPDFMYHVIITNDAKSLPAAMRMANFGIIAKMQSQNIEVESAIQNQQQAQFVELNKIFSNELSRRLHRGLFSYFWSLFRV